MNSQYSILRVSLCFAGLLLLTGAGFAQTISLTWNTVAGGGGVSIGGVIEIEGTIGQADAGAMTGGNITIAGGFWPGAVASAPCPGDVNDDRKVDLSDLAILLGNYGISGGATWGQGDLNGDGKIDLADLANLLAHYGNAC